jgi:ATP/maltotriose-dependent transcriptional regulator MalT
MLTIEIVATRTTDRAARGTDTAPLSERERLLTEGWALAASTPVRAAALLARASLASTMAGEYQEAVRIAADARLLGGDKSGRLVELAEINAQVFIQPSPQLDHAIERSIAQIVENGSADALHDAASWATLLYWAERHEAARRVLEQVVRRARILRTKSVLPKALDTLAIVEFELGRWSNAKAHSAEALRIASAHHQRFQTGSCLTTLATIAAAEGRSSECRRFLEEASELAVGGDYNLLPGYIHAAAGFLELSLGQPEASAKTLGPLRQSEDDASLGNPMILHWEGNLIEAYARSRRVRDAYLALERFERRARASDRNWANAAAARCRGLLLPAAEFDVAFETAFTFHAQTPMPFEVARTKLCYGERLRRRKRAREARQQLEDALESFGELGAAPWAERALRELEPPTRRRNTSALTTHERQVAGLVAAGAKNREAAAALFVSEKTIEYHLSNIYRKLDLGSRTQLALAAAQGDLLD